MITLNCKYSTQEDSNDNCKEIKESRPNNFKLKKKRKSSHESTLSSSLTVNRKVLLPSVFAFAANYLVVQVQV